MAVFNNIGTLNIDKAAGGDWPAVASVFLTGPRGGFAGHALIDQENAKEAIERLQKFAGIEQKRPVVLVYIDGDQYGGEPTCFAGAGEPLVITYDAGRYDKYNDDGDGTPRTDYEGELEQLVGHEAHDVLDGWITQTEAHMPDRRDDD